MPAPVQTSMPVSEQTAPPLIKQTSESLPLMLTLAFVGGFLGAYTCLSRGGVTVHTPRGNLTRLGINLAQHNFENVQPYLYCTIFFLLGITLTILIRHRCAVRGSRLHWQQVTVLISAAALAVMAFLPQHHNLAVLSLGSFVWGSQTETFLRVRRVDGEDSFDVGGLHTIARNFCNYSLHGARHILLEGLTTTALVVIFVAGSMLASFSVDLWQDRAILVCSGLLLIVFFAMFHRQKNS